MNAGDEQQKAALKEEYVPPRWKAWSAGRTNSVVFQGEPPEPLVDIIAVQGLASTYERTWTKNCDDGTHVMWLRDLLPKDLPNARILTFEYDSKWLDDPNDITLEDCAKQLLDSIIWDRSHHGETSMCKRMKKRPLVLIGHSFGGLVIKQAIILAANAKPSNPRYDDYQSIATSLSGIIYLGTPHAGSEIATWGKIQARIWGALWGVTSTRLLSLLEFDDRKNGLLVRLENSFREIRIEENCPNLANLQVFYFKETKPLTILGKELKYVVTESSAYLGGDSYNCAALDANHKNMNKFGSRQERNYIAVADQIKIMVANSGEIIGHRWGSNLYNNKYSSVARTKLKSDLAPLHVTSQPSYLRHQQIRHTDTCTWAVEFGPIAKWLDPHQKQPLTKDKRKECVWINGKPGSGKSVLSTYLFDRLSDQVRTHNRVHANDFQCSGLRDSPPCRPKVRSQMFTVLYFLFQNGQKFETAMSTIIHQLLEQHADDLSLLDIAESYNQKYGKLSAATSTALLVKLLQRLPLTYILLDGIDEWDASENSNQPDFYDATVQLLGYVDQLCQVSSARLVVVSRRDLVIENYMLENLCSPASTVDIASHSAPDINRFIKARVSSLSRKNSALAECEKLIREDLICRASGMFQWIKLIISALEIQGITKDAILDTLEHFPESLSAAYQRTFKRLSEVHGHDAERAMWALKWLACAHRPMTCRELYTALELKRKLERPHGSADKILDTVLNNVSVCNERVLETHFTTLLGPLVEFYSSSPIKMDPRNQQSKDILICHHSLVQLLIRLPGSRSFQQPKDLDSLKLFCFLPEEAHNLAALTCMTVVRSPSTLESFFSNFYKPTRSSILPPFVEYAVDNWIYHLRAAGFKPPGEQNLLNSAAESVKRNLHLIILLVGGLSQILEGVNAAELSQMMQAIPIRDLQQLLLPTVDSLGRLSTNLPILVNELRKANKELSEIGKLRPSTWLNSRIEAYKREESPHQSLDINLESPQFLKALSILESSEISLDKLQDQIELLRDASRKLRQVTIRLAVDPIRSWLYHQVGESGINPIPALSHLLYALDTLIVSSVTPRSIEDRNAFRDQFTADLTHPLYGFITSTRYELEGKGTKIFTAADYKNYILGRYLLRPIEWRAIQITTVILQAVTSNTGGMSRALIGLWHSSAVKIEDDEDDPSLLRLPTSHFDRTKPRPFTTEKATPAMYLYQAPLHIFLFMVGVIVHRFPGLQRLFEDIASLVVLVGAVARPWANSLVKNWQYTSIAIVIWFIRRAYCPWFLDSPHLNAFEDLKGIWDDPLEYRRIFIKRGWPMTIVLMVQYLIGVGFLMWDVLGGFEMNDGFNEEQEAKAFLEGSRGEVLLLHLKRLGRTILRLIFVEWMVYGAAFLLYSLLVNSKFILLSSDSSWSTIIGAAAFVGGKIFGQQLANSVGVRGIIQMYLIYWLVPKIPGYTTTISATSTVSRYTLVPVFNAVWFCFTSVCFGIAAAIRYCSSLLGNLVEMGTKSFLQITGYQSSLSPTGLAIASPLYIIHPRILILLVATLIIAFFALFIFVLSDPLGLQTSRKSCTEAKKETLRITGKEMPLRELEWSAGEENWNKRVDKVEFVDMHNVRQLAEKGDDAWKEKITTPSSEDLLRWLKADGKGKGKGLGVGKGKID